MEFPFNINEMFKTPIVEITHNLIPPGYTGDRRGLWDAVSKVGEVVNKMGAASAAAQGLPKPITSADRMRNTEHKLYLLVDQHANKGKGAITGMLKTGNKSLYVFDKDGNHYQVSPPCLLDFYVHESRQRNGLGKTLFEHMLQKEGIEPVQMAIDRPSDKLLGFLNKHYSLNDPVKQMNNYVVFDEFFPRRTLPPSNITPPNQEGVRNNKVDSKSANGLQAFDVPLGRYGAPRPPCSIGQIIQNQSPINQGQEATGIQSMPATNQSCQQAFSPATNSYVTQSAPNVYYGNQESPEFKQYQEQVHNYQETDETEPHADDTQYDGEGYGVTRQMILSTTRGHCQKKRSSRYHKNQPSQNTAQATSLNQTVPAHTTTYGQAYQYLTDNTEQTNTSSNGLEYMSNAHLATMAAQQYAANRAAQQQMAQQHADAAAQQQAANLQAQQQAANIMAQQQADNLMVQQQAANMMAQQQTTNLMAQQQPETNNMFQQQANMIAQQQAANLMAQQQPEMNNMFQQQAANMIAQQAANLMAQQQPETNNMFQQQVAQQTPVGSQQAVNVAAQEAYVSEKQAAYLASQQAPQYLTTNAIAQQEETNKSQQQAAQQQAAQQLAVQQLAAQQLVAQQQAAQQQAAQQLAAQQLAAQQLASQQLASQQQAAQQQAALQLAQQLTAQQLTAQQLTAQQQAAQQQAALLAAQNQVANIASQQIPTNMVTQQEGANVVAHQQAAAQLQALAQQQAAAQQQAVVKQQAAAQQQAAAAQQQAAAAQQQAAAAQQAVNAQQQSANAAAQQALNAAAQQAANAAAHQQAANTAAQYLATQQQMANAAAQQQMANAAAQQQATSLAAHQEFQQNQAAQIGAAGQQAVNVLATQQQSPDVLAAQYLQPQMGNIVAQPQMTGITGWPYTQNQGHNVVPPPALPIQPHYNTLFPTMPSQPSQRVQGIRSTPLQGGDPIGQYTPAPQSVPNFNTMVNFNAPNQNAVSAAGTQVRDQIAQNQTFPSTNPNLNQYGLPNALQQNVGGNVPYPVQQVPSVAQTYQTPSDNQTPITMPNAQYPVPQGGDFVQNKDSMSGQNLINEMGDQTVSSQQNKAKDICGADIFRVVQKNFPKNDGRDYVVTKPNDLHNGYPAQISHSRIVNRPIPIKTKMESGYSPQITRGVQTEIIQPTPVKLERPRSLIIQQEQKLEQPPNAVEEDDKDSLADSIDVGVEELDLEEPFKDKSKVRGANENFLCAGITTPSPRRTPSHLTEQGYFDLKFYHNKLW